MKRGYHEWISNDPDLRFGFITNPFGRILYINQNWPEGKYERVRNMPKHLGKHIRDNCVRGREFTKEELMLELL